MDYRIVRCVWKSGEHYRMLVDAETGMPTTWPTLYVTTQIRNRNRSVATMEAELVAILVLLRFTDSRGIDLEERILTRRLFTLGEIDTLCDSAQRPLANLSPRTRKPQLSKVARRNIPPGVDGTPSANADKSPPSTVRIPPALREAAQRWRTQHSELRSVVLYGSRARPASAATAFVLPSGFSARVKA